MKKLRVILASAVLAGSMLFVSAPSAKASSASCAGDPNVCVLICQVGLGNKYTKDLFKFCYVW